MATKKLPLQSSNITNTLPNKTIEETYQKKTQLEHILLRPDTYIGSIQKDSQTLWVWNDKMEHKQIDFVPGLYKIFDEILVNAADNKQRDPSMDKVKVEINAEENFISVYNNGAGVPVEVHQEEGVYVPELIFGHLLTSSNYNDDEKKTTGGRNGFGAKLANIFSTEFVIETADGKRLKKYKQVFTNNMANKTQPLITKCKANENWTKVTFKPDLAKFNMTKLEDDVVALMKKRVIDIAGCLGKSVKVELNGTLVPVKSFFEYCKLYIGDVEERNRAHEVVNDRWEVVFSVSQEQFQQVSFVNSIATIKGGTHVDSVTSQITSYVINAVNKKSNSKNKYDVKAHAVKSHMWIFVNALIDNPAFDSQTKETLTTRPQNFGSKCELSSKFLEKVNKSQLVELTESWAKYQLDKKLKKGDGSKKDRLTGIQKLDDANLAGTKRSKECTLILTEGDSAKCLAVAGISVVGRDKYGVFPLRGKLLNVREASHKQITENVEIQTIKKILGLQHGKQYDDVSSLRYGHLMIMTDQDHDGSHIKGLLINFVHTFWPSLLKIKSFLVEFITPIVKATKNGGTSKKVFYTMPEYESWRGSLGENAKGWVIKYYKGLGTSTTAEGKEYFAAIDKHKKEFQWVDDKDGDAIEMAFSKKKIEARKNWLRQCEHGTYLDHKEKDITYTDFVNKELILFSLADLQRSIPSMVDGLKPGQRKILFCCFKRNFVQEAKVAQFSGYVSEHSAYHHGEQSLQSTIVGMAQDFVGSNNINLLAPMGQFGSRMLGGKDHASARYIFTKLMPIARALFHKDDDGILDYLNEDGQSIEPFWYIPIIPMVLVNGSEGIGTGWSSYIPNYNPRDIIANVRRLINGKAMEPMNPWYRGFKGTIEKTASKDCAFTYTVCGTIQENETNAGTASLEITELPVRSWFTPYKDFLEAMTEKEKAEKNKDPFLQEVINHCDEARPYFKLMLSEANLNLAKQEGLLKKFKLSTTFSTSNMHLFDPKGIIKKYDTPEQILEEFFHLRLEHYEKRKKLLVANLELELLKLSNKVRFILAVVNGEIIVSNRKRKDLFQELHQKGFTPFPKKAKNAGVVIAGATEDADVNETGSEVAGGQDGEESMVVSGSGGVKAGDYDYLLLLAIGTLTLEKVQELISEKDMKADELVLMRKIPSTSLWLNDLDRLEKELDNQEEKEAKAEDIRLKNRANNIKNNSQANNGKVPPKPRKKNTPKIDPSEADTPVAAPDVAPTETVNVVEVKPKGKGAPKKAPAKKSKPVLVEDEKPEDEVDDLVARIARSNIRESPNQSITDMEMEAIPEEESDEEFVPAPRGGKKKPAATKAAKPAAGATRKRGPAANKQQPLSQKLITDVLKPAESSGVSPDKKVRKLRPSPFNKKSSSVLGRIGGGIEGQSGGSSSASGSPDVESEDVVVQKARPQRANRRVVTTYVLSDSSEEADSDESEFDVSD